MSLKFSPINFSLFEFTRRVYLAGRISLKGLLLLPLYYLQIIPMVPFAWLQHLLYRRRIRMTSISKDPIFILGHYRSGTTLLQKLLVSDKRFGYLSYYDALFPNSNLLFGEKMKRIFQWLIDRVKIKNPFFHDRILQLSEPDEEDDYLMNKASVYSAYWGLIFPKCWRQWLNGEPQFSNQHYSSGWKKEYLKTIKYITFKNKGKQLVLKNPPNTERIHLLLELFPSAKFIFIHRNPYHLYYSIRNMWKRAIINYYSVQKISDDELDELIFNHFDYLIDRYKKEKHLIPAGNLIEISYEELTTKPFETIRKIYTTIGLDDFELAVTSLKQQLEKEKEYRNFQYQFDDTTLKKIEKHWKKYIDRWNYRPPPTYQERNSSFNDPETARYNIRAR